jgi:hypothetical protein
MKMNPLATTTLVQAQSHLAKRLVAEEPEGLTAFRTKSDIVDNYKRMHTLFRRIARTVHETVTTERVVSPPEA